MRETPTKCGRLGRSVIQSVLGKAACANYSLKLACLFSSFQLKKRQERILTILTGKRIPFEMVDIAVNEDDKHRMRHLCGVPTALPPQVFKGEKYLGVSFVSNCMILTV